MAYKNKLINNSKTGQSIRFIQTGGDTAGELLEMETPFRPFSKEPPRHYHPYQVEDFTVLSGELSVRMDGQVVTYRMNDSFHVPINKVHSMWNASYETTVLNWKVRPALNMENLSRWYPVFQMMEKQMMKECPAYFNLCYWLTNSRKNFAPPNLPIKYRRPYS